MGLVNIKTKFEILRGKFWRAVGIVERIPHNIKAFFKNCVKYRSFLWNDRWFDSAFIFIMLREKLKKDLYGYKHHAMAEDSEEIVGQLEKCIAVLNRIVYDDYDKEEFDKIDDKWGEISWKTTPTEEGMYRIDLSRPHVKTEEDKEQYKKELFAAHTTAYERKKKDIDNLFDYMKMHIVEWWD